MSKDTNRGRPLPWAIRQRLEQLVVGGESISAAARQVGVCRKTAHKYLRASLHTFRSSNATVRVESIA